MERQTFINQMMARGYELETVGNGNITATKGGAARQLWRLHRYANSDGYNAQGRDGRRNTADSRRTDLLTIQP